MGGNNNGPVEVVLLRNLRPGERVSLPDGDQGVVTKQVGDDVYVEHPGRAIGRGPWVWQRWQIDAAQGGAS